MDLLPSLSVFLRVTETGSFSRAADSLGMTRSMVTRRIQALEEDLGTKLFFRSTRKVTLSSEGMELLVRARDLLAKTNALYVELRDQAGKPLFGSIRIASSVIIGWVFLQKVVQEFLDANPGVTIELVTEDQPIKWCTRGSISRSRLVTGFRIPQSPKKSELSRITSARVPNSSKSRARFPARVTSKKSIFW